MEERRDRCTSGAAKVLVLTRKSNLTRKEWDTVVEDESGGEADREGGDVSMTTSPSAAGPSEEDAIVVAVVVLALVRQVVR